MSDSNVPREIPKTYSSKEWEDRLYERWLESGFFNPDKLVESGITSPGAEPFSIVLPPPNATGTLHIGHAAMLAIEDVFVRFERMRGKRALWIPGTDHAAIATQSKVEKKIFQEEGKTRYDLGREAFLERVGRFVAESRSTIVHQCKKMGASLDWSREAFTLDEARHQAVNLAFKTMYDDGIIYRGERIVNWDPVGQTTISDDEVVYQEEAASFYYLKYGPFTIGTARPETKFGDKYVVMHPDDARYKEYAHGTTLELEWINGPITATIIKDESVDPEFGTGVMTITPWHSLVDFEIAERHGLDREPIIDLSGKLLPVAGEFAGMPIAEAREKIIQKLEGKGLVERIDADYVHQVATAERTGAVVEPQIMRQWFVDVNREFERGGRKATLKTLMQEAVRRGETAIVPKRFEKTYFHWIDNLRPWCISRQIWYGHRIPVWYRGEEVYCGITAPEGEGWEQDPDTLDTWFSSGLWTFSTLGWGSDDERFARERAYHPTALLETGYDILFFWVARMILMSTYLLGEVPFKTVYLHGLVRDDQGRKMSKSLENIVDPIDVIEEYGTDALRLALTSGTTPGNDLRVGDEKLLSMRNFVNKLWNMGRYVLAADEEEAKPLSLSDRWMLERADQVAAQVTRQLESYQLSLAIETLRDFTWGEFADWYIEIHKVEKNTAVLRQVFERILILWHPFMPFVTEALWEISGHDSLLLVARWPNPEASLSGSAAEAFGVLQELVTEIRTLRAFYRLDYGRPLAASIAEGTDQLRENLALVERFGAVRFTETPPEDAASLTLARPGYQVRIFFESDFDAEAERARLSAEIDKLSRYEKGLAARLSDENFTAKAPAEVRQAQEKTLAETRERIEKLSGYLRDLK